jgi:hypothetical protein
MAFEYSSIACVKCLFLNASFPLQERHRDTVRTEREREIDREREERGKREGREREERGHV